ncbi:MAG: transcriptional regulator NrdR [Candidatus Saccharibacteria bacterium]|nr:transcriptional regulator NrdR [Candidatus Saccharibacteria bacterium]MCY4010573.1 transcriptional regulator NrdR [Candidatus Saccharibacteria bacterium]MCY4088909.1 transcriptional regulator NrdR [Candidatus Saccharibacteria bacterium]
MKCFQCDIETKVLESRQVNRQNVIRRRRECCKCQNRFTTYERIETSPLIVIKNDGAREYFKFDKLLAGLLRATKKTKMDIAQTEALANLVEKKILALGKTEIKSSKIGSIVIEHLATRNKVAYLRFVSVYRGLKTLNSFERELSLLKQ